MTTRRFEFDGVVLGASLILLAFGLTMVMCASASLDASSVTSIHFNRQLARAGLGLVALLFAYLTPPRWTYRVAVLAVVLAVSLVVLTLTPLGRGPDGQVSARWLKFFGVVFQPSEALKLALVVYLAGLAATRGAALRTLRGIVAPVLVVVGAAGLIALQPNMGTAVTIALIGFGVLLVAGARLWHLVIILGPLVGLALLRIWSVGYERRRLVTWLTGHDLAPDEGGYQVMQSLIALGSGGWWGVGFGESLQKYNFLPAAHTDFIFAIIGEEGGFWVSALVLAIYALIVSRAMCIAWRSQQTFHSLCAAGIGVMIGVQVVLNVAVVTGLAPTTGLPLPFLSYGGSSLIVHLTAIGVLLRLSAEASASLPRTPGRA